MLLAKSRCVIAGLDVAARSVPPARSGRRRSRVHHARRHAVRAGHGGRRDSRAGGGAADRRAHGAQLPAAAVGHRHADAPVRRRGGRPHHGPRHAQDDAAAARAGEVRRARRRRRQPSLRPGRRHADQGQPRAPGGRREQGRGADARGEAETADRGRGAEPRARSTTRCEAGADIVLLDNLSTPDIIEAVRQCRGRAKTEISGGVTLARLPELAATGADFVSVGALTHSAPAADLSFEIEPGSDLDRPMALARANLADRDLAMRGRSARASSHGACSGTPTSARPTTSLPRSPIAGAGRQWWWRTRSRRAAAVTAAPGRRRPARDSTCPSLTAAAAHAVGAADAGRRRGRRRRHSGGHRSSAAAEVAERHLHRTGASWPAFSPRPGRRAPAWST